MLVHMEISRFKCIDYIDYRFKTDAPFVLLSGMNGVGKSCIIEAVGFALGICLDELRVKDVGGLVPQGFVSTKNRTFCNLTFANVVNIKSEVIIGSYIDQDDKTRCYSLNRKKVSKTEFDSYLKELNISRSSGFYISQNHIHSIMAATPKDLYKSIVFASNVGTVQDEQKKIEKEIVAYKDSNNLILMALNKISEKIDNDEERITKIERNAKISIDIINVEQEIAELDLLQYFYSSYNILQELRKLMSHIARYNKDLLAVSKSIDCESNILQVTADAASVSVVVSQEIQDVISLLSALSTRINENILESKSNLSFIDKTLDTTKNVHIAHCKLEEECRCIEEKLENLNNDINSGINNCNSITVIITDRRKEIQSIISTKSSVEYLVMSLTDLAMSALANEHEILSEHQQLLNLMSSLKEQEHELLVATCEKSEIDNIGSTAVDESQLDCKVADASQLLQETELQYRNSQDTFKNEFRTLQAIQSQLRLPISFCSTDNVVGDFGYLADIICFNNSNSDTIKYNCALNIILGPLLSIRIVSDSLVAAHKIHDEERNNNYMSIRIWPLNKVNDFPTLSDLTRPKYYKDLLRNGSFVDPTTLIGINESFQFDCNISKVVTKALGSYILCDNDTDAMNTIDKYQVTTKTLCIITKDGVMHRPGSLYLSEKDSEHTTCYIRLLNEYQIATSRVHKTKTLTCVLKGQIDNAKASVLSLVKLKQIISEIKVISHKINLSNDSVTRSTTQRIQANLQREDMILKLKSIINNINRLQKELEHINKCYHDGVQEHELAALHIEYQMNLLHSNNGTKQVLEQQLQSLKLSRFGLFNSLESLENQLEVCREKQNQLETENKKMTRKKSDLLVREKHLKQRMALVMKQIDISRKSNNNSLDELQEKKLSDEHKLEQLYANLSNFIQRYKKFVTHITTNHPHANDAIHLSLLELFDLMLHFQKEYRHSTHQVHSDHHIIEQNASSLIDIASEILASLPLQTNCSIDTNHDRVVSIGEDCLSNLVTKRELLQSLRVEYIVNSREQSIKQGSIYKFKKMPLKRKRNPKHSDGKSESDDSIDDYSVARKTDTNEKHIVEELKSSISHDRNAYLDLRVKFDNVSNAIVQLSNGIQSISGAVTLKLSSTFQSIRTRVITYFHDLVQNKQCDLIQINLNDLSSGVKFVLVESTDSVPNSSINELSGGQKGLLSLAFVFALCNLRPSPLYLLDEVDAALDDGNQMMVAKVIAKFFKNSQVICVSHHTAMQVQSDSFIDVQIENGKTIIV